MMTVEMTQKNPQAKCRSPEDFIRSFFFTILFLAHQLILKDIVHIDF